MSGWDARSAGIDPGRVAELIVTPAQAGPGRRGSGYRVSASAVLTAAHVVRDAARVQVRFNADRPGEWLTEGTVEWSDSAIDAAVVVITPPPQDERQVTPVAFGRVAERDAVLVCSAMGFPRFKLRDDGGQPQDDGSPSQYRDSAHAVGTIAVLANRRQGTLEVSVPAPERDPDPARSPWEGMSGAAVFSGGRIIGLVAEHHRGDGLGRLAATRMDRWYVRVPRERFDLLRTLLPVLPTNASGLVNVVPPGPGELLEAGYTAQVRNEIAPEMLLSRDQELAELVQFCAGEEPYQWWQAPAWAGKTALAAWFVLHPPAGVTVVSFFVTRRLAGEADSDAYTRAMIEQLAAVAGEQVAGTATLEGRDRERHRLLDQAAKRVAERLERLVLVVDGLDEDEGVQPGGGGRPSIASRLPRRPPDSVRVLVTSRPSPGVPEDIPSDHPLRHCRQRPLTPSPHAHDIEVEAKNELSQRLHGDHLQVDVVSYITAAGGGLTMRELAELTTCPVWTLEGKFGSVFGRSLRTRTPTDRPPVDAADQVYLFAHETLRAIAQQRLANDLGPYRQRIDAWADAYRDRGWPETTPRYLLRSYGRFLESVGNLERLIVLATDARRHDRMLVHTQGDATALSEIATAQQILLAQQDPDLVALGRLAVYRYRLANRNRAFPIELPALWVRLGQSERGEALARSVSEPYDRARALGAAIEAFAEVDRDHVRFLAAETEQAARNIGDLDARNHAFTCAARALAGVDRTRALSLTGEAERAAHSLDETDQDWALTRVAEMLAHLGHFDRAEQVGHGITDPHARAWAMAQVTKVLAEADGNRALALVAEAEEVTRDIIEPAAQAEALCELAKAVADVDQDRATSLVTEAENAAYEEDAVYGSIEPVPTGVWNQIVEALAKVGQWNRAEQTARSIAEARPRADALTNLAIAIAQVDRERASSLAAEAEQTARSIAGSLVPHQVLGALAEALASAGQWDRADWIARTISDDFRAHDRVLGVLAESLASAGYWDRAEETARSITQANARVRALGSLADSLANDHHDRAMSVAAEVEQTIRATSLDLMTRCDLAKVLTRIDRDRALSLLAEAEETARNVSPSGGWKLGYLVETLAAVGCLDHAERAARGISHRDGYARAGAFGALIEAVAGTDRGRALSLAAEAEQDAQSIDYLPSKTVALVRIAKALTNLDRGRALSLWTKAEQAYGRSDDDPESRVQVMIDVVRDLAGLDRVRVLSVAIEAEQIVRRISYPPMRDTKLADLAEALACAWHWDRAEEVIRSINDFEDQARALAAVIEAMTAAYRLTRAGDEGLLRVRICRLLAEILAGEYWVLAIRPLGKISPSAVIAIDGVLYAQNS